MADRVLPGPATDAAKNKDAVCIHTRKIFDSCRDKDCIEDLRVYPTRSSQCYIEGAFSIRPRSAELLHVDVDVEEITFKSGFYTVDVKYYYWVKGNVFPGGYDISGLAVFDKRVILFGSEGQARIFTSGGQGGKHRPRCFGRTNLPVAIVEVVDPIALGMKLVDPSACPIPEADLCEVPEYITAAFGEEIVLNDTNRRVYVTLGQFSLIRLERDTQLMVPVYDYCMPERECPGSEEDDPCALFSKIRFPVEEFFPADNIACDDDYRNIKKCLC